MHRALRWTVFSLLTLTAWCVPNRIFGQETDKTVECSKGSPRCSPAEWAAAANRWQLTPSSAAEQGDTVSEEVRAARSTRWRRVLQIAPTSPPLVDYDFRPSVDPVFDRANHIVWAIGTFDASHVYAAGDSPNYLYTEMNIHVDTVVFDPRVTRLTPGTRIDLDLPGGCLREPDGKIKESRVWPRHYALEPGKRYLLALFPRDDGAYTMWSDWEIAHGKLLSSSYVDEVQVKEGKSQLVGLSTESAVDFIRKLLATQQTWSFSQPARMAIGVDRLGRTGCRHPGTVQV